MSDLVDVLLTLSPEGRRVVAAGIEAAEQEAAVREREECARVAECFRRPSCPQPDQAQLAANAIRARGRCSGGTYSCADAQDGSTAP